MEFRSCPACKASVLEDDVDDCPFCGASMSGKPAAKAPEKPVKPAASASQAAKPTAKPSPPGGTSGARPAFRPSPAKPAPSSDSDDPFEVDTSAAIKAIKLAPRATQKRTLEVKCPMCDTAGFMQPEDAGKDVHCANPNCTVPVFKSRRVITEAPPVQEAADNRPMIFGGGAVAAIIAGACFWFFVLAPKKEEDPVIDFTPQAVEADKSLNLDNVIHRPTEAAPTSIPEIRETALAKIVETAQSSQRNRSKEFAAQLASEALAESGNLKVAQQQLGRLQRQYSYLQVQPLTQIGWQQLATGKAADAQATALSGFSRAKSAPTSIRRTLDSNASLSALLISVGKSDEAGQLIEGFQNFEDRGRLSTLWRSSIDSRSFRIDVEAERPWHILCPEPMRTSIVEALVCNGQIDKGLEFTKTGANVASQENCLAAWAGRVAERDLSKAVERVTAGLSTNQASASGECLAWSAVASVALTLKNEAVYQTAIANAQSAAEKIEAVPAIEVPEILAILESEGKAYVGLPNPAPATAAGLAQMALAAVQIQHGDKTSAWENVQLAINNMRATALSATLTQQMLDECEKNEPAVRERINVVKNAGGNEQTLRTEFSRYRRQVSKLHSDAVDRLQKQAILLRFAAQHGLLEDVTEYTITSSQVSDAKSNDAYSLTSLPGFLMVIGAADDKLDITEKVNASFTSPKPVIDPLDIVYGNARKSLNSGNYDAVSQVIRDAYRAGTGKQKPDRMDEITLHFCAKVQSLIPSDKMLSFIKNLHDELIQEDAFLLLAGYSINNDKAADLFKVAQGNRSLGAIDEVAIYRGFVAGLPNSSPLLKKPSTKPASE
ncbi:hypothetical protein SH668x_000224 [Planctomicrobium sp. SH668]|uniref:hypothetical protein n=1 Tax=Planctomicrobium sp. SH668 TaxID=3448126 RepID=UPI003F5C3D50